MYVVTDRSEPCATSIFRVGQRVTNPSKQTYCYPWLHLLSNLEDGDITFFWNAVEVLHDNTMSHFRWQYSLYFTVYSSVSSSCPVRKVGSIWGWSSTAKKNMLISLPWDPTEFLEQQQGSCLLQDVCCHHCWKSA
jgi:hypothetical protein